MDSPAATRTLLPDAIRLDPDFHIVVVFCLIGLLATLCAVLLFPELGTILGQFTLS
jgi:hypothetical protein